jgi:hypothetical protein
MSRKEQGSPTFLDLYLNGEVLSEEIDDFIDEWHAHPGQKDIFEFLGMTTEEYSLWLRDPESLPHIARARRAKLPLANVVRSVVEELPLAARAGDSLKLKRLIQWLERQGKTY